MTGRGVARATARVAAGIAALYLVAGVIFYGSIDPCVMAGREADARFERETGRSATRDNLRHGAPLHTQTSRPACLAAWGQLVIARAIGV